MALYSVKKSRGRKIKKNRKSKRGKGHGKTRRYKVFKNTKNHTLGKRKGKGRQMKGGELNPWTRYDDHRILDYINVTYNDKFVENRIPETGFTSVEFKMDIRTMITNRSKGYYFREDNKHQRILIYACLVGTTPMCYALVRVPDKGPYATPEPPISYHDTEPLTDAQKSKIPIDGMETKILFIFPGKSEFTGVDITDSTTEDKDTTAAVKDSLQVFKNSMMEKYKKQKNVDGIQDLQQFTEAAYRQEFKLCQFESFISSDGDKYRIFLMTKYYDKLDELLSPITSEEDQRYGLSHGFY